MLLDLKDIFINQKDRLQISYSEDLFSDIFLYDKVSSVNINADIVNNEGVVNLILNIDFSYDTVCDRCNANLHRSYNNLFVHTLVLQGTDDKEDYIVINNHNLDLDKVVIDDILLDKPSKILCTDHCKGLCPKCGIDLNYGKCDCKSHQLDPRLEVLKQFIDKDLNE